MIRYVYDCDLHCHVANDASGRFMRIGLVCYAYPPLPGGVSSYTYRLAGALGRVGHDVHVVAGPSQRTSPEQINVTVHRIAADFHLRSSSRVVRWLYWNIAARLMGACNASVWHLIRWTLATEAALLEIDRRHPLDLVEAPEFAANGWMAGRLRRWPLVVRMHCPWELFNKINKTAFDPMNVLLARLERHVVARYADLVTAPSNAMRQWAGRNWTLRRPMQVVPNFIDVPESAAELPGDDGALRVLCVGRLEPLKGQDTLCRAFAMIADRHPRAELWLVGADCWGRGRTFARVLQQIVPDPAIRQRIHLTGVVSSAEVDRHGHDAHVYVQASIGFENFSLSTLEAMALGRPIIATKTGGLPELLDHGKAGVLVEPGSTEELAAGLDGFLSNAGQRGQYGQLAFQRAKAVYDTPRVLPQLIAIYEEAAVCFRTGFGVKGNGAA